MTALLTNTRSRKVIAALTLIGFAISAPMLVSSFKRYRAEAAAARMTESQFMWSLPDSPLVNAWGAAARQIEDAKHTDVRSIVRNAGFRDKAVMSESMIKVVTPWWWMLPAAGFPRWIGVIVSLILLIVGIWVLKRTLLAARTSSEPEHDAALYNRTTAEVESF